MTFKNFQDFQNYVAQNSYVVRLSKYTRTLEMIDDFDKSKKKYLLLYRYCSIDLIGVSLIAERKSFETDNTRSGRPSLTFIKQTAGACLPKVWSDSNWYCNPKLILYPVFKQIVDTDESIRFPGNIIALDNPFPFNAQGSEHRYGFGREYYGTTLMYKRNYGVSGIFEIVGFRFED